MSDTPHGPGGETCTGEFAAAGENGRTDTVRRFDGRPVRLVTVCGRVVVKQPGPGEYALGVSGIRLHTDDPTFQ